MGFPSLSTTSTSTLTRLVVVLMVGMSAGLILSGFFSAGLVVVGAFFGARTPSPVLFLGPSSVWPVS